MDPHFAAVRNPSQVSIIWSFPRVENCSPPLLLGPCPSFSPQGSVSWTGLGVEYPDLSLHLGGYSPSGPRSPFFSGPSIGKKSNLVIPAPFACNSPLLWGQFCPQHVHRPQIVNFPVNPPQKVVRYNMSLYSEIGNVLFSVFSPAMEGHYMMTMKTASLLPIFFFQFTFRAKVGINGQKHKTYKFLLVSYL